MYYFFRDLNVSGDGVLVRQVHFDWDLGGGSNSFRWGAPFSRLVIMMIVVTIGADSEFAQERFPFPVLLLQPVPFPLLSVALE
jgi:hypothetical protein